MPVTIAVESTVDSDELRDLYDSVGWSAYTRDIDGLTRAVAASHLVLTARDETGLLVGLARTISDGETACYLPDLLVRPAQQRHGVGRRLLTELLARYAHCRFFVLSTADESTTDGRRAQAFYRSMGLVPHAEQDMTAYARRIG